MQNESEQQPGKLNPGTKLRLKKAGIVAMIVAGLILVVGLFIRYRDAREANTWTQQQAIPAVIVISPHHGSKLRTLVLPGSLQPYVDAPIYARVNGYLLRWYHDIGARVKTGQLLADIDTPELDQQLEQAKADLVSAIANQDLADVTARRWINLLATDSVSKQETDQKIADLAARRAQVDAARANVRRIEAFENFKHVVAPFDGVVTARKTDVGALINAGSGIELFNVATVDPLRLYVPVPQYYTQQITAHMAATLTVPEYPGRIFKASVSRTSGSINGNSGTLLVELSVDNKEGLLTPGSYAEVKFELPENAAIQRVPASALIFRAEGLQLAVVGNDSRVKLVNIVVGRDFGTEVEVAYGIEPNDRVVDSPPDSLESGDLVRVMDASQLKTPQQGAAPAKPVDKDKPQ